MLVAAAQIAAARGLKMKLILENFRKFVNEEEIASIAGKDIPQEDLYPAILGKIISVLNAAYGEDKYNLYKTLMGLAEFHAEGSGISENDDKVSKKISYLMDKEGEKHDRAVAIALDMEEKGKLEEGFKSGEKVTHAEYGDGVVTHPGTKNTNVAVKFDKDTGRGKNVKVSRGSLKKVVKEAEEDAMRFAVRPGAGIEDIPQPEDEETVDRAFDSPEGRLITLIQARKVLGNMTREELMQLAADLDGDMVTALRHILSDKMYAPTGEFDSLPQIGDDPRDQSPLEESDEMKLEQRLLSDDELRSMPKEKAIAILMGPPGVAKAGGHMSRTDAVRWLFGRGYTAANHGLPPRHRR